MRTLIWSGSRSSIQDTAVDAAQGLGLRFNTLGPWNAALPQHLLRGVPVWVRFDGAPSDGSPVNEGVVKETSATSAKRVFQSAPGTEECTLECTSEYVLNPPVFALHPEFYETRCMAAPKLLSTPTFFQPTPDNPPRPSQQRAPLLLPNGYVYRVPLTPTRAQPGRSPGQGLRRH